MMRLTQNTVVTWLNEPEDAGYVARIRDPQDRRKHNVALTEKGAAALERAETELRRIEDEVLSGLNADERTRCASCSRRRSTHRLPGSARGMNKHRFVWHDLNTKDLDGSKQFYGEIFDWKFEERERPVHAHHGRRRR